MKILAIVGSPRRDRGLSERVAARLLAGASGAGAQTETLYLSDEQPEFCRGCGHSCFAELDCIQEPEATERSAAIEAADALVLCAPVYCWQPNGLTAALFDKVRLSTGPWRDASQHGKPALGVAVAGGTGSGVFTALQSIYAWFCLWKYRPLPPVPVTRFNLEAVLEDAGSLGRALVNAGRRPYGNTGELLTTYDALPALRYGRVDEFRWLARTIVQGFERRGQPDARVASLRKMLAEAEALAAAGDAVGAADKYAAAHLAGLEAW